jgi:nitroimidazol reductase NimA-like FMN-containing flavoprotein (pyridoxamine 5'-phosphate oxidase superfamily)
MDPVRINTGLEELTERECLELLDTEELGRIGLVVQGRPEIFPVNYALDRSGCVVFRTALGMKLANAVNHHVVFEVDRADPGLKSGWSVIVRGVAHHTVAILPGSRPLAPWLLDKPYLIRIAGQSVTGRRLGPPS